MVAAARSRSKKREFNLHGAMPIDPRVGHNEAQRRELAGKVRNQSARNGCIGHEIADVGWTGAAERDQYEIARIKPLLREHAMQRADHVVVGDVDDR